MCGEQWSSAFTPFSTIYLIWANGQTLMLGSSLAEGHLLAGVKMEIRTEAAAKNSLFSTISLPRLTPEICTDCLLTLPLGDVPC